MWYICRSITKRSYITTGTPCTHKTSENNTNPSNIVFEINGGQKKYKCQYDTACLKKAEQESDEMSTTLIMLSLC